MIKTWKHKGLRDFYLADTKSGIKPEHSKRLKVILLHSLKGYLADYYSVSVNGNWRIIFQFAEQDAFLVDYVDYH